MTVPGFKQKESPPALSAAVMTLAELRPGRSGRITKVGGEGALRRHLLDMGLTPKTHIHVSKVAPLGDPIELRLRGYVLTLRKEDAARIEVVPEDGENPVKALESGEHVDAICDGFTLGCGNCSKRQKRECSGK